MLNVPDTVKALFKRDGVRKNFRVHFPNGELPDITNENIVQESVKFTESLCSQDVLKFGLTEASVIEFETVGIPNMYGMTIECGIEIDLSSLTAAQLNDIASGTWDGVYTDLASSDIGYAYFRVPYGVFRIESCPRDHQAMTHRKVKAYSESGANSVGNPYETQKINLFYPDKDYCPNIYLLSLSFLGYKNNACILDEGFIFTALSIPTGSVPYQQETRTLTNVYGQTEQYRITFEYNYVYTNEATYTTPNGSIKLYYIDQDSLYSLTFQENPENFVAEMATAFENYGRIDLEASGFSSWEELTYSFFPSMYPYLYPAMRWSTEFWDNLYLVPDYNYQWIPLYNDNLAIYPKVGNDMIGGFSTNNFCFVVPFSYTIERVNGAVFYTKSVGGNTDTTGNVRIHRYTRSTAVPTLVASFNSTLQNVRYHRFWAGQAVGYDAYSFANSYSAINMLNGYLELIAKFGRINRNGGFDLVQISDASPITVLPGEYSSLWWDEYDVLPIGSVKYSFTNSNKEECVVIYQFGSGASTYDMSGNEVLKAVLSASESAINALLDSLFIPNLSAINFTPIELDMKGLPYMESGDYLAVTAEDSMIANSFNMKMEINGIQVLTANIESTSGDIIESGEST